jgi:hypothetical protein
MINSSAFDNLCMMKLINRAIAKMTVVCVMPSAIPKVPTGTFSRMSIIKVFENRYA